MARRTQVKNILEDIYGPDQAQGIGYLYSILDIEQLYRERAAPICINVPELESLTNESYEALTNVDKVTISLLLDSLSSLSTRSPQQTVSSGFTWEALLNALSQAGFLEPLPGRQRPGISKDVRGKRKVRWFRRKGDPGLELSVAAVYELLLQIIEQDPEAKTVDLEPLRRLISGSEVQPSSPLAPSTMRNTVLHGDHRSPYAQQAVGLVHPIPGRSATVPCPAKHTELPVSESGETVEPPPTRREPMRGNSTDSTRSVAHSLAAAARYAFQGPRRGHAGELIPPQQPTGTLAGKRLENRRPPSRLAKSSVALNASSAQKYSLEPRSSLDWPVMEIITLRFPTTKEPYFTVRVPPSSFTVQWADNSLGFAPHSESLGVGGPAPNSERRDYVESVWLTEGVH